VHQSQVHRSRRTPSSGRRRCTIDGDQNTQSVVSRLVGADQQASFGYTGQWGANNDSATMSAVIITNGRQNREN
jgi:hypothetical protein